MECKCTHGSINTCGKIVAVAVYRCRAETGYKNVINMKKICSNKVQCTTGQQQNSVATRYKTVATKYKTVAKTI